MSLNKQSNSLTQEYIAGIMESFKQQRLPEPHLHLVKSVVFKGYRFRAIWNTLHYRPLYETFHEFIIYILKVTFGEEWRKEQMALPEDKRHILIRWVKSYNEWKRATHNGEKKEGEHTYGAIPSGEVMALHSFAYDIYCLQVVNKLPDFLIERLKNRNEFQGARYEVAVAAIIARAGYDITFLDDKVKSQRHCDFIAKNKYSGEQIAVEAKSRRRKGVLHEKGDLDYSSVARGDIQNLFKKAYSQKPENIPYFIFIDLNVMPTPDPETPPDKKSWFEDIKSLLDEYKIPSKENPEPFNALVLTNFSYYYWGNAPITHLGEYNMIIPQFPEYPCKDMQAINEIWESLGRYAHIPNEV